LTACGWCTMATMLTAFLLLFASAQDVSNRLTGDGWREWTLYRFEMTMGASGACKAGAVYRFSADHTVTIRECKDGQVTTTNEPWKVSTEGDVDTFLVVGAKQYHLFFKTENGTESMRLEIRPDVKEPIQDYDFRLTKSGTGK
jgi:hypothetical protein